MSEQVSILNKIKQKGILTQIRQYLLSGMLLNTGINLLTLGKSKTALELIQMNKMLKVKKRLRRKYTNELAKNLDIKERNVSNIIWTLWLQGMKNAPAIVKRSIKSIKRALPEQEVVILDGENFKEYVDIPEDILNKWKTGIISNQHFSDIIRMELLIQHGGTWIDSTVFLESNFDLLQNILDSDQTFFFQNMRPGQMGNSIWLSSWFIHSTSNEPTLLRVREILYNYWRNNNFIIDYFLFHIIWHLVYESHQEEFNKVKKIPNALPLQLMYLLNEKNDKNLTETILEEFPLQKLTYKNISSDRNTTYWYLMGRYTTND
ncbi:capsular polysaccharide synthesis protein [Weissella paramesenteroides]|uniref:capsular polysaccharide synthesis protein n=1 Tax=Weissella paramesenteroides TaxID=1249 RepID=UPI003F742AF3